MSLIDFITQDNVRGLFPLNTTVKLITLGKEKIRSYVYDSIFNTAIRHTSFLPMPAVYALKERIHVRKSLQLDPISSFYIYDFVYRNSGAFQKTANSNRKHYGYSFRRKIPANSYKEYHEFREKKYELKKEYRYFAKIDIANCFNSFYHHDIISYLSTTISQPESKQFGQFLREGNGGRSIDCFPQGIYPAKVIGNFFLSFIENSRELQSDVIIRFLDDTYLFSDNIATLEKDVLKLQSIIGEKGLFLNPQKTKFGEKFKDFEEKKLDKIQKSLVQKREVVKDYEESDNNEEFGLNDDEVSYLKSIIQKPDVAEEDVELALSLLKEDESEVLRLVDLVFNSYPNLIKQLYHYVREIEDEGMIWGHIYNKVNKDYLHEYELFWISRMVIDHYQYDEDSADLLIKIFNHRCATSVVKASILEIEQNDFGLYELKERCLRDVSSGIPAASAVIGLLGLEKAKRNQLYKYSGNASSFMHVICDICSGF